MAPWKLPPQAKVYEAFSALADGRVRIEGPGRASVRSSAGDKTYTVEWSGDFETVSSNDNASYWQGYLGYPIVAVLLAVGKLEADEAATRALAGDRLARLERPLQARLPGRRRPRARWPCRARRRPGARRA